MTIERALAALPLFQSLSDSERRVLASASQARRLQKGEWLFCEGAPAASVWVLRRGCVHLIKHAPHQGPLMLGVLMPHEALCGISAFEEGAYSAGAVAATDTEAIQIPWETFSQALDSNPRFGRRVLAACCERIRQMADAIALARAPAVHRLTHALLRLQEAFGDTLPLTHQELAQMAGIRWETSIRTLSAMRRKGWVATGRGRITLLTPRKLRALLRDDVSLNGHGRSN